MSIFKKPQTKLGIWLLCFVLTVAIITTGTLAWFVMNTEVSISSPSDQNLAVQVNAGDLEVSVSYKSVVNDETDPNWYYGKFTEYSPYSEEVRINAASPQFIDVTGGGKTLWFPNTLTDTGDPLYSNPGNWRNVTDVAGYTLTLKIKFKTSQTMDVYLDNDSYILGVEEIITGPMVRSTAIGPFSTDGICAATRAAFLEVNGETEALKTVWIPNDRYRLVYNEQDGTISYVLDGEREEQYIYYEMNQNGAMEKHIYSTDDIKNGSVMIGNYGLADSANSMVNGATPLLSFTSNGSVQEKELIVRIWFEGTDAEASTYLDGGKVKYNLAFVGINKKDAELTVQDKIANATFYNNALRYEGEDCFEPIDGVTQVLYSYDGIEWTPYGTGAPTHMKKGTYDLFIKSAETLTNKSSSVKLLEGIINTVGVDPTESSEEGPSGGGDPDE